MDPETTTLHSCHIFLFPFKWEPTDSGDSFLEEQFDLSPIARCFSADATNWEQGQSWADPSTLAQYNEANYFYDFVRPVLYGDKKGTFQLHYRHKKARGSQYVISLSGTGDPYRLDLDDIGISFFNTGVGILSFHCFNRHYPEPTDILKINQFGRRLYPPFLGTDPDKTGTQAFFEDADWAMGLERVQKTELARTIWLEKEGTGWAVEDFSKWEVPPRLDRLPDLVAWLLPPLLSSGLTLSPVLDDRMFVVCWYGNDELAGKIRDFTAPTPERNWWYKYLFVDGEKLMTSQNESLTQSKLADHSNTRWLNFGTLYGVSRYSFVCLTSTLKTLQQPHVNAAFLVSHIQTIYFKLAELALVQRACVLRFSDEITAIGEMPLGDRHLAARAASLSRQYIRFINKIYFREVTAQEQGIELYDLLQTHMRLDNQVKDLDNEIQELHQYVSMQEENARNTKLDLLTYIGAFFVVPSFVCTYLSINDFDFKKYFISVSALCLFSALGVFGIFRWKGTWQQVCIVLTALLMLYVLFGYPAGRFN